MYPTRRPVRPASARPDPGARPPLRPRRRGQHRSGVGFLTATLLGALAGTLLVTGCETVPTTDDNVLSPGLSRLAAAGDWATLSATHIKCQERTEGCAKAYGLKGDACLRLAISQPPDASAKDTQVRGYLDCAEDSYRTALAKQATTTEPSRVSYHGGLLLTLSERRNRLDDRARDKKLDRENEKLMMAAQDARREAAGSALGYLYGASAHAYRAMLLPRGRDRCPDLRQAEMLLSRSPPPPLQIADEEARIASLVRRELGASGCPRIARR